jgi:superfamily II DNA or RNA helicase
MELRDYQKTAVRMAVRGLLEVPRVALVMPTGSGKTVVASEICKHFQPIIWTAHQDELLRQGKKALKGTDHRVMSAFTRKLPKKLYNLLVIDEFHHEGCDTYRTLLDRLSFNLLLGITATRHRPDGIPLRFDRLIEVVDHATLVERGYLSRMRLFRVRTTGEYIDDLISWVNAHGTYVGKTIFFVKDLAQAAYVKERLSIVSEIISGESNRELCLNRFREGTIQCLISCLLLTEGVDLPMCRTAVLRPTNSRTLLTQMIGRTTRTYGGKKFCNIVEPAFMFHFDKRVSTEDVITPDEKYISHHDGISKWRTRLAAG